MKATFDIDASIMRRLHEEAARCGTTVSALVEAGVQHVLDALPAPSEATPADALPPVPTWNSGGFRVDIADRDALCRTMEEPLPSWCGGRELVDIADRDALSRAMEEEEA